MTEEISFDYSSSSIYFGEDLPVKATGWFIWEMPVNITGTAVIMVKYSL